MGPMILLIRDSLATHLLGLRGFATLALSLFLSLLLDLWTPSLGWGRPRVERLRRRGVGTALKKLVSGEMVIS